jgi:hypothetical protein
MVEAGGHLYCTTCLNKQFKQCGFCAQYHPKDDVSIVEVVNVCAACYKKQVKTCGCCGKETLAKNTRSIDTVKHGEVLACTKCYPKFALCSMCNKFHDKDDIVYHKYVGKVCPACAEEHSSLCPSCGERHMTKHITEDGLCVKCKAAVTGQPLDIKAAPRYAGLPEGWEDFTEEVG